MIKVSNRVQRQTCKEVEKGIQEEDFYQQGLSITVSPMGKICRAEKTGRSYSRGRGQEEKAEGGRTEKGEEGQGCQTAIWSPDEAELSFSEAG
jgi:hypothetical protein